MTSSEHAILALYANLMDEVKVRIDCIDRAIKGQTGFPAPIVREFCFGQLRMLCELLGLSCLVAHGDIPVTHSKRIGRRWSADQIMDDLSALRPHFYPQPVRDTGPWPVPHGQVRAMESVKPEPFPKTGLLELYSKTHAHVHRGNIEKLMKSATPIDTNPRYEEIISWAQRINDQLHQHVTVVSDGGGKVLFCVLRNAEDNNQVQASFITGAPPPVG